jgi:hypothetical protein
MKKHTFFDIFLKFEATKYFHIMLILKVINCIFDKKIIFFSLTIFLMYFEFFQNFDKVFAIKYL